MISGTEIVVYVYMALCICMLFYNLIYIGISKIDEKLEAKRKKIWKQRIKQAEFMKHEKYLKKKLERIKDLFIFDEVLKDLTVEEPQFVSSYIEIYQEAFVYLAKVYEKKESLKKAYFAYIVSQYNVIQLNEGRKLSDILVRYTGDSSVYCRENALKALYALGNKEAIVSAYRNMNRNGYIHHGKLVLDGLILFQGNKKELADELWKYFKEFDLSYQISFVDFIRMVSDEFCETFFWVLQDRTSEDELKFAIIRYYRKYRYEPAKDYLLKCIQFGEGGNWEYAALAASALVNYASKETIRGLKSALAANNWYTRYNAADSLLQLGVTYVDVQDIYNGNDRYAREMIKYKMLENNL